MKTTIYSINDITRIVNHIGLDQLMDEAISSLTTACQEYDEAANVVPVRAGFEYSAPDIGLIEWMPAMKTGSEVAIKVVGYHPTNPQSRGLPTILSTAMTFDTQTGHLLALLDGTFLTAVRTGAASAIASRILASPESRVLGLIGAGAQSITQLHALSRVFKLNTVMVYDTDESVSNSFRDRASTLHLKDMEIVVVSLEQLVSSSHIICTATSVGIGEGPVFQDALLQCTAHINAVGSDFPGKVEVPVSLLQRSLVCPDFLPQAVNEGECQQLDQHQIGPDLVELVKNQKLYTSARNKCSVFDSTGWAFEDHIIINILNKYGQQLECGTEIALASVSADPRNPYAFCSTQASDHSGQNDESPVIYALNET